MSRRILPIFLLLLLTLAGVNAQPEINVPLSGAVAYLPESGKLILVDDSSVTAELVLPLPSGFDRNASTVSVNGNQIAYIARKQGSTDKALTLAELSPERDALTITATQPLRTDAAYTSFFLRAPGAFGLRDGITHLAVGYGLDPLGWELLIVDEALNTVAKLTHEALPDQPKDYGYSPYPIHFRPDGSIAFALIDAQTGGVQNPPVFVWNTFTNALTQTTSYAIETDVYDQSGELISINQGGLQWFNSYTGELARFYVAPSEGETMGKARFVSDAQFIAFTKGGRITLVQRDGVEIGVLPGTETASDWYGLRDGLVVSLNGEDGLRLVGISLAEGLPGDVGYRVLTTLPTNTIVQWVYSDMRVGVRAIEHVAWATIDGATFEPLVVSGESPLVTALRNREVEAIDTISAEGLFVGGWATTFADGGDQLNVRAGAGRGFDVITRVNSDVLVQLIEGPVEADGLVWWRVLFPTGRDGWLVQEVDGVQTLVEAAPPPTPTPTPTPLPTATPVPPTAAPLPTQPPSLVLNEISSSGSAGSSQVSVTFSWSAYPGAAKYLIDVLYCKQDGSCEGGFSDDTARTSFNASFSVNNPTLPIRWRVTAVDANGATLVQSGYVDSVVRK
jgi:hypothetical protein